MRLANLGRRRLAKVGVGALILSLASAVAIADNLQNDASTTSGITTITERNSTTITYRLVANANGGSAPGCDATPAEPVTVAITKSSAVSGATSLSFTGCGSSNAKTATFSSSAAGSYPITHSTSGGVSGSSISNQANFTLTVNAAPPSNSAPSLTLPADRTVEATGGSGAAISYTASASDAQDGSLTPTCSPVSGSTFALGITQVNCSVTDSGGMTTLGMFNVAVVDTTAPVLNLPANKTEEATGPTGAAVSFSAVARDVVDGTIAASCDPPSGDTFPLGTTTVNCSATDAAGNTSRGSFTVTVRDTTAPVLTLPASKTEEATGPTGAAVSFSTTARDAVDGGVAPSCDAQSGDTFPLGTTTVNCSATDAAGNTSRDSFTVTIRDTTAPALVLPNDIARFATLNGQATVSYTVSANDLVDGSVSVSCSPASGSAFVVGSTTVQCAATDAASNRATGSFRVTVSYNFGGFRSPIDGGDVLNVAKAGSTIPVKFSLSGDQGLNIWLNGSAPGAKSLTCTTAQQDTIEETSTATTSGLKYDSAADQYIYNWKTSTGYANTCQQLVLRLADGSTHTAKFKFTK